MIDGPNLSDTLWKNLFNTNFYHQFFETFRIFYVSNHVLLPYTNLVLTRISQKSNSKLCSFPYHLSIKPVTHIYKFPLYKQLAE